MAPQGGSQMQAVKGPIAAAVAHTQIRTWLQRAALNKISRPPAAAQLLCSCHVLGSLMASLRLAWLCRCCANLRAQYMRDAMGSHAMAVRLMHSKLARISCVSALQHLLDALPHIIPARCKSARHAWHSSLLAASHSCWPPPSPGVLGVPQHPLPALPAITMKVLGLLLLLAAATVQGQDCPGGTPGADALWRAAQDFELPDEPASKIVYNDPVDFAQGTLRTYARMTGPCDPPAAIGLEMSAGLQDDLPGPTEVKVRPPPECESNPMLPTCFPPFEPIFLPFFDEEAPGWSPFRLAEIDWSPLGHHPPGVYETPHWDLHFYLINQTQIEAITPGPCTGLSVESYAAAQQPVPSKCFPGDGYANINAVAPLMGNHYVKMDAPEMIAFATEGNGVPAWNESWIWGSDAGEITFFEVMVKRSYLLREPTFCSPIPGMPSEFAIAGYKPSTYCIVSTGNATLIELRDFTWYDAGCKGEDYAPASYMTLPPGSPPLSPECDAVVPKLAGAGPAPEPAPVQAASAADKRAAPVLLAAAAALMALAAAVAM